MTTTTPTVSLKTWLIAYLPPVLWAALIFILSAQSVLAGLEVSVYDFIFKKSAHIFVYAILYFLLFRAFTKTVPTASTGLKYGIPLIICIIYAVSDEYHQSLVPGRYPTPRDVGYDMIGMAIAILKQSEYI